MRALYPFFVSLAALLLAAPAAADVIAIRFKDAKIASKHKDRAVLRGGELMLIGEQLVRPGTNDGSTTLILANPDDPLKVPYKLDKEGKPDGVKNTVTVPKEQVAALVLIAKDGSLLSLAQDYADRRKEYDDCVASRNEAAKGSAAWMAAHQRVLTRGDRLGSWLDSMGFPGAAAKMQRELAKERKLAESATLARLEQARNSVKPAEIPSDLGELQQEIGGGAHKHSM